MTVILKSRAFENGEEIPAMYTCKGDDVSPPLNWEGVPDAARSLVLIIDDPDAPDPKAPKTVWVHWVLYNIPGSVSVLEQGSGDYTPGTNDFGNQGYGGPMPPEGHGTHHYFFWLLALDKELNLEPGLNMWDLLHSLEPHTIAMNRLVGTYQRG